MGDQINMQPWQPFYTTLAGISVALAGLVFVAMSFHAAAILQQPVIRSRAFITSFGFLTATILALLMLAPAQLAPVAACGVIAVGAGGFLITISMQVRSRVVVSFVRSAAGDTTFLTAIAGGVVGIQFPQSQLPFVLAAVASTLGNFCSSPNHGPCLPGKRARRTSACTTWGAPQWRPLLLVQLVRGLLVLEWAYQPMLSDYWLETHVSVKISAGGVWWLSSFSYSF